MTAYPFLALRCSSYKLIENFTRVDGRLSLSVSSFRSRREYLQLISSTDLYRPTATLHVSGKNDVK